MGRLASNYSRRGRRRAVSGRALKTTIRGGDWKTTRLSAAFVVVVCALLLTLAAAASSSSSARAQSGRRSATTAQGKETPTPTPAAVVPYKGPIAEPPRPERDAPKPPPRL